MHTYSKNKDIKTIFPHKKFENIVKKITDNENADEAYINNLSKQEIKLIFLNTLDEFICGNLHLEEVADIANVLFGVYNTKTTDPFEELCKSLYAAAELTYYVRSTKGDKFLSFRNQVLNFYEKNKHELKNSPTF